MTLPTPPAQTAPASPDTDPHLCLLHADFHTMVGDCWSTTLDWFFDHQHLPEADRRAAYAAEVERVMLNTLVQQLRLPRLGGHRDV